MHDKFDKEWWDEMHAIYNKQPLSDLFSFSNGDQLKYVVDLLRTYSEEIKNNYFTDECTVLGTWTMYNVKILSLINFLKSYLIKSGHNRLCKLWLDNYAGMMQYMDQLKKTDHDKFATYAAYMSSAPSGLLTNLSLMFPTKNKLELILKSNGDTIWFGSGLEYLAPSYGCDWTHLGMANDELYDLLIKAGLLEKTQSDGQVWHTFLNDELGISVESDKNVVRTWTKIANSVNDSPAKTIAEAYSLLRETDLIISELVGTSPDDENPLLQDSASSFSNWSEIPQFIQKLADCRMYAKSTNKNFILPEFFNAIVSGLLMEYTIGLDKATVNQYHSEALKAWRGVKAVANYQWSPTNIDYFGPTAKYSAPYYTKTADLGAGKLIKFSESYQEWPGIGGDPETGFSMSYVIISVDPSSDLLPNRKENKICDMVPNFPRHKTKLAAYPVCLSSFGDFGSTLRRTTFDECFGGSTSAINTALTTIAEMDSILSMVNLTMDEIESINTLIDQILNIFEN